MGSFCKVLAITVHGVNLQNCLQSAFMGLFCKTAFKEIFIDKLPFHGVCFANCLMGLFLKSIGTACLSTFAAIIQAWVREIAYSATTSALLPFL